MRRHSTGTSSFLTTTTTAPRDPHLPFKIHFHRALKYYPAKKSNPSGLHHHHHHHHPSLVRYCLESYHLCSNRELHLSYDTFQSVHQTLVSSLRQHCQGHVCSSGTCSDVWIFLTTNAPKRMYLRSPRSSSVIESRLDAMQVYFSQLLRFIRSTPTGCEILTSVLPRLVSTVFDTISRNMIIQQQRERPCPPNEHKIKIIVRMKQHLTKSAILVKPQLSWCIGMSVPHDRSLDRRRHSGQVSPTYSSTSTTESGDESSLHHHLPFMNSTILRPRESESSTRRCSVSSLASTTTSECSICYHDPPHVQRHEHHPPIVEQQQSSRYTTLDCGHVFHDECIVDKLNEALVCPECHVSLA